jgi:GTPase
MNKLPSVVIVGRMNVGKSTLFNRLSTRVKSLTFDYAGVTRDFIKDTVVWNDYRFELIDTGGINLRKTTDSLLEAVTKKALEALEAASVVLIVIDGAVGITPEDREIAKLIHKLGKKALVVFNKFDTQVAQEGLYEAYALGFDAVVPLSAQHGTGIGDLLDLVVSSLPKGLQKDSDGEPLFRVMLLGKPNVGKSSLMNTILRAERSIVSAEAGTTREALSERITFYKEIVELTDTPGIRRQKSVTGELEPLMVKSSFQALKKADIVVQLLDVSEGKISAHDLKLAFYAFQEQHKALMILCNKSDLLTEVTEQEIQRDLEFYENVAKKVPFLFISCKTGKNVGKVLPLLYELWYRYSRTYSDEVINRILISSLQKKPLFHGGIALRLYSAHQMRAAPFTVLMKVNEPAWFGPSQLGFFENTLRSHYDLLGVPIKFVVKKNRDV